MSESIDRLLELMATLRGPNGCPWDRKQDFKSIAPCTLEEAYEVVDAIESGHMDALREELGDLLLQVVFHAQMASEKGLFNFNEVATTLAEKLVDRHPHVFGDHQGVNTAEDVIGVWEGRKAVKRASQNGGRTTSVLDGLSTALPSTTRALKLSQRMARVGFDWPTVHDVMAKLREETAELEAEIAADASKDDIENELGDVMFALVNLARHFKIDPEKALRRCNHKVERRFRGIEERLAAQGRTVAESDLDEMEKLWGEVKKGEFNE